MYDPVKVAIQGERASFHEIAALNYYKHPIELIYCQSFKEVFNLLKAGRVNKIFVAVSNSNHGEISEVKQLIEDTKLSLEGEYCLPIEQHVIGLPETDIKKISKVISHPVALSQCSQHIKTYFSNADLLSYHDTSAAVEYVKERADPSIVAIGSEAAANLHGLKIVYESVQDDSDNTTVFNSFITKSLHLGD